MQTDPPQAATPRDDGRQTPTAEYLRGLRRALEIVRADGKPGPGGINMTNGIPSEIYIGIGRGRYEDERGEYDLAQDTADSVRGTISVCIQREIDAAEGSPRGN